MQSWVLDHSSPIKAYGHLQAAVWDMAGPGSPYLLRPKRERVDVGSTDHAEELRVAGTQLCLSPAQQGHISHPARPQKFGFGVKETPVDSSSPIEVRHCCPTLGRSVIKPWMWGQLQSREQGSVEVVEPGLLLRVRSGTPAGHGGCGEPGGS